MNFSCDKCQRRYSIADDKVRGKTVKVRCKNCQNVISVQGPPAEMEESTRVVALADVERIREQERAMAAASSAPAARAPAPAASNPWEDEPTRAAPARQAGAPWFVMVKSKQEGPLDEAGLSALVQSGSVNARSFFWQQGMADWKRGGEIPELAGLFEAPAAPPAPPPEAARGQRAAAARAQRQPEPEPQESAWDDQPTTVGPAVKAAPREAWDLDPAPAQAQQHAAQSREPWDMDPAPEQQQAWDDQEQPEQQHPWEEGEQPEAHQQAWDEQEQPVQAEGRGRTATGGMAAVGDDLFSDLDLPDKNEPADEPEPPAASQEEPDPLAAVPARPSKASNKAGKKPVEDTQYFMKKSGVTRRNPPWKIALFILLPIFLLAGVVFALDSLNVVPLKVKTVDAQGKTVERSVFSGEGVSELRDRLMGTNKPAPVPAPRQPAPGEKKPPSGAAQKPPEGGVAPKPAVPETGKSPEDLKALYGDASKTDVGPEVRKEAEVAAADSANSGGPPPAEIQRVVAQSQGAIQGCVETELRKNPSFKGGKVMLVATVGSSGAVKTAKLDRPELDGAPVGDCIKKSAKRMVFPAFKAEAGTEDVDLQIPLVLSSGAM